MSPTPNHDYAAGPSLVFDPDMQATVSTTTRPLKKSYVFREPAKRFTKTNIASYTQMQALHDVVKAGYVRYIGMSSCWAYQCEYLSASLEDAAYPSPLPVHAMQSTFRPAYIMGSYY